MFLAPLAGLCGPGGTSGITITYLVQFLAIKYRWWLSIDGMHVASCCWIALDSQRRPISSPAASNSPSAAWIKDAPGPTRQGRKGAIVGCRTSCNFVGQARTNLRGSR